MEQRFTTTFLVDLAFFAVVGFLGYQNRLGEPILAALLSSYAAGRFGVAMGKQQAVVAMSGSGGSGTSGTMRAVTAEVEVVKTGVQAPPPRKPDPRSMRQIGQDEFADASRRIGWMG